MLNSLLDLSYNACMFKFSNEDGYWMESILGSEGRTTSLVIYD
jgi:hypothetical protein